TPLAERLAELSEQTRWLMPQLLEDCLRFPEVLPLVRDRDGIRRRLRCWLCRKAEWPIEANAFPYCDDCLTRIIASIDLREPISEMVLFRTYNTGCRWE